MTEFKVLEGAENYRVHRNGTIEVLRVKNSSKLPRNKRSTRME